MKTFLPIFPGFYNSIFDGVLYSKIQTECDYINEQRSEKGLESKDFDDLDFDYKSYYIEITKNCVSFLKDTLIKMNLVSDIIFEKLVSPKYYNYNNDSIDIDIILSDENKENIDKYIGENFKLFFDYINSNYSSYDGFISSHSNNAYDWISETENFTKFNDEHKLGAVLEFILLNENITSFDLCANIEAELCVKNIDELLKD